MNTYEALASTVIIGKENRLLSYDDSLQLVGTGRSAFVFKIKSTDKAMKIFFPRFTHLAKEEGEIYKILQGVSYYPTIYYIGKNYILMDFIDGHTLFECITYGEEITMEHIKEIDYALALASARGLNPSDIHLRNIFITSKGEIKIIDVARFRQEKDCVQWDYLKKAYQRHYVKAYFPKKIPAFILNTVAYLYKQELIPFYRE
ncbi:protein kinase family protein [Psychrobacillus lasiicapitis]|uniref:Protein kinase family protein n=1 Tax=Psychrobacillus lasiicapitis TaxID=1636719 RepID=A0A544SX86_9BACI|nr:protein kinase family protein [Psychrobacillus lasiicapitis]TQR09761.1 protein kinase family protein [Psychrobacillus lasiicapitis]GGA23291.1 putative serine/threonine-protein kinase YrzF [Psychrobacillus lasiicapitis]